jgi:hypothetical protein
MKATLRIESEAWFVRLIIYKSTEVRAFNGLNLFRGAVSWRIAFPLIQLKRLAFGVCRKNPTINFRPIQTLAKLFQKTTCVISLFDPTAEFFVIRPFRPFLCRLPPAIP